MSSTSRFPKSVSPVLTHSGDWRWDALCAQVAPEEWFYTHRERGPEDGGLTDSEVVGICRRCPALRFCLETALRDREPFGIWAATYPKHRRAMAVAIDRGVTTVDDLADHLRIAPAHDVIRGLTVTDTHSPRTAA
jgi:WhiB family redox-sensing transcriptional regulator